MFTSLLKAAAVVIDVPVSLAADVVTLGGVTTDKEDSYTAEALSRFVGNVSDVTDPDQ